MRGTNSERFVIQVGGTSYSGSTLLDLMLSNAEDAFSCGEVYALFRPHKPHHFNPDCSCQQAACKVWPEARRQGEKILWSSIGDLFSQVRVLWIRASDPTGFSISGRSTRTAPSGS